MKNLQQQVRESKIGRRDFIGISAGAAAAISMLKAGKASAQAPSSQGIPWWAARPGKAGLGKLAAIDMHAHWSPEPYNKALAALGQPLANPYPLDYDLDKRRKWMDDHGDLMHCLTLSGAMPWQRTSAQEGAHLAQVINDTGIQVHQKYPDRFVSASSCRSATPPSRSRNSTASPDSPACAPYTCPIPSNGTITYSIHTSRRFSRAFRS